MTTGKQDSLLGGGAANCDMYQRHKQRGGDSAVYEWPCLTEEEDVEGELKKEKTAKRNCCGWGC